MRVLEFIVMNCFLLPSITTPLDSSVGRARHCNGEQTHECDLPRPPVRSRFEGCLFASFSYPEAILSPARANTNANEIDVPVLMSIILVYSFVVDETSFKGISVPMACGLVASRPHATFHTSLADDRSTITSIPDPFDGVFSDLYLT